MCDPSPMAKPGTSKDCIEDNLSRSDELMHGGYGNYDTNRTSMYSMNMPTIVTLAKQTCKERYDAYCNEVKISDCSPSQVMNKVQGYVEDQLNNKKWLALWKGPYESGSTIDILVEVDDVYGDQAHVSLVEPLVCSEPSLPPDVVEAQLNELGYQLDICELHPITLFDDEVLNSENEDTYVEQRLRQEAQQRFVAKTIDNVRFFYKHIRRDWDEEDDSDNKFDAYLKSRLQLHYDIIDGVLPIPLVTRYNRTMAKYVVRRKELLEFQAHIQREGEPSNSEAVECWKRYYEVLMLSGLLQIWETLQLRADGPCFPRVLRKSNGIREDGSKITHIVCNNFTPKMVRDFPDDTNIKQHNTPASALKDCHQGDVVCIYPGKYKGEGFHELTEHNITIQGKGDRDEIVIEAVLCDDLFVNVCAENIKFENLTFVQNENTEGLLRVETGGDCHVTNCVMKIDQSGHYAGFTVYGKLNISDSLIINNNADCSDDNNLKKSVMEVYEGSVLTVENNKIDLNGKKVSAEGDLNKQKGLVHLHTSQPPVVKILNNKTSCDVDMISANITNKNEQQKGDPGIIADKIDESLKQFANIEIKDNSVEKA